MDDDLVVVSIMLCTSFSTYNLVLSKKKSTYDLVSHWFLNWIFGILLLSLLIVSIIIWNMTIYYIIKLGLRYMFEGFCVYITIATCFKDACR